MARAAAVRPDLSLEKTYWDAGLRLVAGLDEVGRGPLAACVAAGVVVLSPDADLSRFGWARDSKKMSAKQIREAGARFHSGELKHAGLLAWALGAASPREIDRLNIRRATILAMTRAIRRVERQLVQQGQLAPGGTLELCIIDGERLPELPAEHVALPKADATVLSCSLAAIIAKYTRSRLMERLAERYPQYECWRDNDGYPTPSHLAALATHGPVPGHHRMSFGPLRDRVVQR